VEIKFQLDATEVFILDLIASSTCFRHHYAHHQELKSIIQWLLPVVFRAVKNNFVSFCGICVLSLKCRVTLKTENTNSTKITKLFFTFLQHEIPQAATTV